MNFYKHHIGDYDADTSHLSWVEDMAYTRLMRLYYRREQPIPADISQACRLVRATSKQEKEAVDSVLREFFSLQDDGWHNKRCDMEIVEANEFGQEREAKAENEKERQRRHREDRRKLFEELRSHDIVPAWDTKMEALRELLRNVTKTDLSRVTGVTETRTATAIQTPQPDSRYQIPDTGGESARSARATRIPPDFELTPERRAIAVRESIDPDRTFTRFVNHWGSASGSNARKVDWDKTWQNWCMTDADRNRPANGSHAPRKTRFEELSGE